MQFGTFPLTNCRFSVLNKQTEKFSIQKLPSLPYFDTKFDNLGVDLIVFSGSVALVKRRIHGILSHTYRYVISETMGKQD